MVHVGQVNMRQVQADQAYILQSSYIRKDPYTYHRNRAYAVQCMQVCTTYIKVNNYICILLREMFTQHKLDSYIEYAFEARPQQRIVDRRGNWKGYIQERLDHYKLVRRQTIVHVTERVLYIDKQGHVHAYTYIIPFSYCLFCVSRLTALCHMRHPYKANLGKK